MLGTQTTPLLKCKAAECRHLVPLMEDLLNENSALFGVRGAYLKVCAQSMNKFFRICKAEPRQMSPGGLAGIQAAICEYLQAWKKAKGHCVFKHHMLVHIGRLATTLGNPRFFHTYADEEENRCLGTVAKRLHGSTNFYFSFLQRVKPEAC